MLYTETLPAKAASIKEPCLENRRTGHPDRFEEGQSNNDGHVAKAAPAPPEAAVSERPELAPEIVLSGAMEESGFVKPPWMVQRRGQFIHLTDLLYHVVEQTDGQRTLDEIAAALSERTDRHVTADNVRLLIGRKLIPLGIVKRADGTVVQAREEGPARSPLKINMKTKVLPRGLIVPLTNVLKVLYWPPVLVLVLLVCAIAQIWLFFVHGIGGGLREAVYEPWLLLALLGIILLDTTWHEFGHAAALEYGGGEVRGMGMGFYLVYPAFYTDVTDNYRLRRWARVRTDLGGFYFNLIFCLGLIGLYFLTRQEFLLFAVLLTDLEIIHQCLPFVRLDGYWTLVDITGIPDFFSYMGPFLRSIIRFRRGQGGRLPELKRWVKVVFAFYILVTIPVLAYFLFMLIMNVPRILATSWGSLDHQRSELVSAWSGGHYLATVSAAIQLLLLALPVAGLCFTLFTLGKTVVKMLWMWSKPTPARRVVGAFGYAALAAFLAFLWMPNLPSLARGGERPNPLAIQNNWRPVAAGERGALSSPLASFWKPDMQFGAITPTTAPDPAASPAPIGGAPQATAADPAGTPGPVYCSPSHPCAEAPTAASDRGATAVPGTPRSDATASPGVTVTDVSGHTESTAAVPTVGASPAATAPMGQTPVTASPQAPASATSPPTVPAATSAPVPTSAPAPSATTAPASTAAPATASVPTAVAPSTLVPTAPVATAPSAPAATPVPTGAPAPTTSPTSAPASATAAPSAPVATVSPTSAPAPTAAPTLAPVVVTSPRPAPTPRPAASAPISSPVLSPPRTAP